MADFSLSSLFPYRGASYSFYIEFTKFHNQLGCPFPLLHQTLLTLLL